MKKSKITILVIIFFLLGILLDRAFLYYEMGEKNKIMLIEQESLKGDYKLLIRQFEEVKEELLFRKLQDSINLADSTFTTDSTMIEN
jgi:hypothetical protein